MKRFLAILIGIIFLLTLPTLLRTPGSTVDGQTRATGASSSKKKTKPATEETQPSENPAGDEEEKEEEEKEEPEEEEPAESGSSEEPAPVVDEPPSSSPASSQGPGQFYVCSKCGFTTDSEGDCPKCGIALEPMK